MKKILYTLLLLTVILYSCSEKKQLNNSESVSVTNAMSSADTTGFEKALLDRKFVFPDDNGAHPKFRTEWWYFTGNLTSKEGKRFGYQFTIFRNSISPSINDTGSNWRSNQIYMGHFTLTDIDNNNFYYFERFSRDGNKLAGVEADPFKLWLEDWSVTESEKGNYEFPKVIISANEKDINIKLILELVKPIVLQGEKGLSMKNKETGSASYYYSATKIKTYGSISVSGKEFLADGYSWLDREWSTSALSEKQKGWDWFSLQLDNNFEIMYYQIRNKDGSVDPSSLGSIVLSNGLKENLKPEEMILRQTGEWKNKDNKVYPSSWTLNIPSRKIELTIIPVVKNQELNVSVKYWEGSVLIDGTYRTDKIKGSGYVELTGYAD
jgi:predicted secreted hydrolase